MAFNMRGAGSLMLSAADTLRKERLRREEEERTRQAELERMRMNQEFTAGQNELDRNADVNIMNMRNAAETAANRERFNQQVFMNETDDANRQNMNRANQQQNQQDAINQDKINRAVIGSYNPGLLQSLPQGYLLTDDNMQRIVSLENTRQRNMPEAPAQVPQYAQQYRSIAEQALQKALSIGDPRERLAALQSLGDNQADPILAQTIQAFMNTDEEGYYNYHAKWSAELLKAKQEADRQSAVDMESRKNYNAEKNANIMKFLGAGKQARLPGL